MVAAAIIGAGALSAGAAYAGSSQQAGASKDANALQNAQYQQSRTDLAPWRAAGENALSQLQYSLGIGPAPGTATAGSAGSGVTPGMQIVQAMNGGQLPGQTSRTSGLNPATALTDPAALGSGILGLKDPVAEFLGASPVGSAISHLFGSNNASPIQDIAAAIKAGHPVTDSDWAKAGFGPGGSMPGQSGGPTLAQANPTTPGHDATQTSPYGAFQQSPGYQFQFDQGLRAVDQGAASRGMLKSGAAIKDEMRFGQGTADQEYGNWLNRLQAVAGLGQTATNTGIAAGQNYADNASSLGLYGAAARSSGYSGISNAFSGTVNNLAQLGYFNGGASNGYASYANGTWTPGAQGFPG